MWKNQPCTDKDKRKIKGGTHEAIRESVERAFPFFRALSEVVVTVAILMPNIRICTVSLERIVCQSQVERLRTIDWIHAHTYLYVTNVRNYKTYKRFVPNKWKFSKRCVDACKHFRSFILFIKRLKICNLYPRIRQLNKAGPEIEQSYQRNHISRRGEGQVPLDESNSVVSARPSSKYRTLDMPRVPRIQSLQSTPSIHRTTTTQISIRSICDALSGIFMSLTPPGL